MIVKNFYKNITTFLPQEFVEEILTTKNFRMERIISEGHSSPNNFWYDQDENEFVMLLGGSATLSFEDEPDIELYPGDYLIIPAHKKHRVKQTDNSQKTFWLTLFY
jgi:cupin 2 domain-containing protein